MRRSTKSPFMKLLIEQNEDGGKRRNAAKKKGSWKPPRSV